MDDKEAMFETPDYVFKDGQLVVRKGEVVAVVDGATHVARAPFDAKVEASLRRHFEDYRTQRLDNYKISDGEIEDEGGRLVRHDCVRSGA
jgi:formylmethanofuran dehydrogenase subunit A